MSMSKSKSLSLSLSDIPQSSKAILPPSDFCQVSPDSEASQPLFSPSFHDLGSNDMFDDSISEDVQWSSNPFSMNKPSIECFEGYIPLTTTDSDFGVQHGLSNSDALFSPLGPPNISSTQLVTSSEDGDDVCSLATFSLPPSISNYPEPEFKAGKAAYQPARIPTSSDAEPDGFNDRRKRTKFSSAQTANHRDSISSSSSYCSPTSSPPAQAQRSRKGRINHNLTEKRYRSRLNGQFETLLSVLPSDLVNGQEGVERGDGKSRNVSKAEVLILAKAHIEALEKRKRGLEKQGRRLRGEAERWRKAWEGIEGRRGRGEALVV